MGHHFYDHSFLNQKELQNNFVFNVKMTTTTKKLFSLSEFNTSFFLKTCSPYLFAYFLYFK